MSFFYSFMVSYDFRKFSYGGSGFSCPSIASFRCSLVPSAFPVSFRRLPDGFPILCFSFGNPRCFYIFLHLPIFLIYTRSHMVGLAFRNPKYICVAFSVHSCFFLLLLVAFRRFPDGFPILCCFFGNPIVFYVTLLFSMMFYGLL